MQPLNFLRQWLQEQACLEQYLFSHSDLRPCFSSLSDGAFRTLLSRAVKAGVLIRVCQGHYAYPPLMPREGYLLYHLAAKLRPMALNYLSLESVLSEEGVLSQIPMNRITLMSSGSSQVIDCGAFGSIEFVHTTQSPAQLFETLTYDHDYHLFRANLQQALRDARRTGRSTDLIDWSLAHELIR